VTVAPEAPGPRRPNVVLVVADDLGYSDLGCYGGELATPNIDRLARAGVRLAHFYTSARCSPSRASLLTGLHPHQSGIGILTNDDRPRGYPGSLSERTPTMAEVLRASGYATAMFGKWHLSAQMTVPDPSWPTRRGFAEFFGTLTGCGSYYQPGTLRRGDEDASSEALVPGFYYTDAIASAAASYIRAHAGSRPFFCYVAFSAPHWPLHAPEEDIRAYDGAFEAGWDVLRRRRIERLVDEGLFPDVSLASDRDEREPPFEKARAPEWQVRRMQVYAAQVTRLDAGVGALVEALRETGQLDDTLLIFLSDNGASSEELPLVSPERFAARSDILPRATRAGGAIRVGNLPEIWPGPEDTYASYGRAWANLSNAPFRYYKRYVHEGGIAAPFVVHWPAGGLLAGHIERTPYQLTDVLPTVLAATGATYPSRRASGAPALEGVSMLEALRGGPPAVHPLFWEHTGNAAIRLANWKLVRAYPGPWELYDLATDPAELRDCAPAQRGVVAELRASWESWAARVGVIPWEVTLDIYRGRGASAEEAAG